jgi:hypothetical protein
MATQNKKAPPFLLKTYEMLQVKYIRFRMAHLFKLFIGINKETDLLLPTQVNFLKRFFRNFLNIIICILILDS